MRDNRSPKSKKPPGVTKTGAKFDNNMKLATDVSVINQCHNARSPAIASRQ
jgi:hypothetical protein